MFHRALSLPKTPDHSFFLWGPRQTGKSTLLKKTYPDAHYVDLLEARTFIRLLKKPWLLREDLQRRREKPPIVIIDEVQKVPMLLDEVHWMIENRGMVFGLCGSSARKVKRGKANLLGGRAVRHELYGLVWKELGDSWNLHHLLNVGSLPRMVIAKNAQPLLEAYVDEYLKEEIREEGLVRNLPSFAEALHAIALSDGGVISYTTIAQDCGVSSPTVRGYLQILEDTLLGSFISAYRKRPKRRIVLSPKFYLFDTGIANYLAKRGEMRKGSADYGKALENWIHHELRVHSRLSGLQYDLSYWRTSSGKEVDFILGDMDAAVEVKATENVSAHHLKGLRSVSEDFTMRRRICVSLDPSPRRTDDGIDILPVETFLQELWEGKIIQ